MAASGKKSNAVVVSGRRAPLKRDDVKRVVSAVLDAVLSGEGRGGVEVSVLFTDDDEMRGLNKRYRKIDKATDVLSFEMDDLGGGEGGPVMLGDIVISVERARVQAASYGVAPAEETARLLVHGALHLLGYDHEKGGKEAARMKRKEAALLKSLGM